MARDAFFRFFKRALPVRPLFAWRLGVTRHKAQVPVYLYGTTKKARQVSRGVSCLCRKKKGHKNPGGPPPPGDASSSIAMALETATAAQAVDPAQLAVVAAAAVALEAQRSAADMRKRRNEADLASTLVHVQRLRDENRRPNTRSTYSKCWRLWTVSAGPWTARLWSERR